MNLLHLEWANLAKLADGKPVAVQVATRGHRSYSTASPERSPPGMFVRASRPSTSAPSAPIEGLGSIANGAQTTGETTPDAVGLFELSSTARPMALAVSNDPLRFGDRFHGLVDGVSSAAGRPAYGTSAGRRAQKGLAGCCDDPATRQSDPLLTTPTLADNVSGPVPELGVWTLMIFGLGLSGLVLRGERRRWA